MKKYIIVSIIVILWIALPVGIAADMASEKESAEKSQPSTGQTVNPGAAKYRLQTNQGVSPLVSLWQVNGSAGGGNYRLVTRTSTPPSAAAGCCCLYLPCARR
jgi:hypothetical protein